MLPPFRAATLPADVADFTLTQAVAALRCLAVNSADLVDAATRRHVRFHRLGAYISHDYAGVRVAAAARAPGVGDTAASISLEGVPIAIKDNLHAAGFANTAGTPGLAGFRPSRDGAVVGSLRRAGALIVGKTNMHELSLGVTSHNAHFGDVRNALDSTRLAGGSSGGSAIAVALGMAYGALGTDTAGSIRIPAALNGVVGLRPTVGRYPSDGMAPVCPSRDTAGPMGRTVSDVALLDQAITGDPGPLTPPRPERIRLGVVRDYFFDGLDAQVHDVAHDALRRLRDNGVQLIELSMPGLADANEAAGTPIGLAEFWPAMQTYLHTHGTGLSMADLVRQVANDDVRYLLENFIAPDSPHRVPPELYEAAIRTHRPALRRMFVEQFCRHKLDGIILPTTITVAGALACGDGLVTLNDRPVSANYAYLRNTLPASNAGLPGLALPAGITAEGHAVGIEIDGRPQGDRDLLAVGLTIEAILAVPQAAPRYDALAQ
jgi:mandelamide amidase